MHIHLNGQAIEIAAGSNITQLLQNQGFAERRVAVEVNRSIVPKSQHSSFVLSDQDKVEIVHALGGG